jgi:hypothetical protein
MARKEKLASKAEAAKAHVAGSKICVTQTLEHSQFGAVAYLWPRFWTFHSEIADAAFSELTDCHKRLLQVPVGPSNFRLIDDAKLLSDTYRCGTSMISNVVRTIQHFAEEIEGFVGKRLTGITVAERLGEAASISGLVIDTRCPGYVGFVQIWKMRDAVEHSTSRNTYAGELGGWDRVPLAWLLSDKAIFAYQDYRRWFERLAIQWDIKKAKYSQATTFEVVRGIVSEYPSKK